MKKEKTKKDFIVFFYFSKKSFSKSNWKINSWREADDLNDPF